MSADRLPHEPIDVGSKLLAAHAAGALAALLRLAEAAERLGRAEELPRGVIDAMIDLPDAIRRWS